MAIARATIISGPAKVSYNSNVLWTEGDISVVEEVEVVGVKAAMFGTVARKLVNRFFRISFTPYSDFSALSKVFPAAIIAPATGARLTGSAADVPLIIYGVQGDQWEWHNAAITGVPTIQLGTDVPLFSGQIEFTAIIKNEGELGDDQAIMKDPTSGTEATQFTAAETTGGMWSGAIAGVTGFTSFRSSVPWQIRTTLNSRHVPVEGLSRAVDLDDVLVEVSCAPVGVSFANLNSILEAYPSGALLAGALSSAKGINLVLTPNDGSGMSITVNKVIPTGVGYDFGTGKLRVSKLDFVASISQTLGANTAILTFANT